MHSGFYLVVCFLILTGSLAMSGQPQKKQSIIQFNPLPLQDEWTQWVVGDWEGQGESTAGKGSGVTHVELALGGQFLIFRGEAKITSMTVEQEQYLKKNMRATDEEIARFKKNGYEGLEIYTIDPKTGEVVGYLFDSLRCTAQGRGRRQGNKETIDWVWWNGTKGRRVTERVGEDRMRITEITPMADGTSMEDKGEMRRRKK